MKNHCSRCKISHPIKKKKKLSVILEKEKSVWGRFLIFFDKDRGHSFMIVLNGKKTISKQLLFWLKLFQLSLPKNAFFCEEGYWRMRCASLVPRASCCYLLLWLSRGAMERERLHSSFFHPKGRSSLLSLGLKNCAWCSLFCLTQWGLPILFQSAEITTFS